MKCEFRIRRKLIVPVKQNVKTVTEVVEILNEKLLVDKNEQVFT
jgi:hypothetical protein